MTDIEFKVKYQNKMLNKHIKTKSLAKLIGVSPRTVRNWANSTLNPLPCKHVNGILLFDLAEVESWLSKYKVDMTEVDAVVDELLEN